jgi:hypothetical protein
MNLQCANTLRAGILAHKKSMIKKSVWPAATGGESMIKTNIEKSAVSKSFVLLSSLFSVGFPRVSRLR